MFVSLWFTEAIAFFWSQTITDEEDDYHATKLREQIDAAMAAEQAAAPQQEAE
jgi:hypothetical protein